MPPFINLPLPTGFVADLLKQEVRIQVADYLAKHPPLDWQHSVVTVAEVLAVSQDTVRSYFNLPHQHPRRLPYIDVTGTARGRRVLTSDITAWQQRNRPDSLAIEIPVRRPACRRP